MRKAAAFMTIAMLAGCGQSGDGGNGTASAPAGGGSSVAGGVSMQPGEWESRIEVANAEMPQLPPGVTVPSMQPITARFCMTPEQAANPTAQAMSGNAQAAGCTTENYTVANGRISGATVCTIGGTTSRTTINGEFTATSYEMNMESSSQVGGAASTTRMRVSARRVGDCPASQ